MILWGSYAALATVIALIVWAFAGEWAAWATWGALIAASPGVAGVLYLWKSRGGAKK